MQICTALKPRLSNCNCQTPDDSEMAPCHMDNFKHVACQRVFRSTNCVSVQLLEPSKIHISRPDCIKVCQFVMLRNLAETCSLQLPNMEDALGASFLALSISQSTVQSGDPCQLRKCYRSVLRLPGVLRQSSITPTRTAHEKATAALTL